jgi:hypothetical protein
MGCFDEVTRRFLVKRVMSEKKVRAAHPMASGVDEELHIEFERVPR